MDTLYLGVEALQLLLRLFNERTIIAVFQILPGLIRRARTPEYFLRGDYLGLFSQKKAILAVFYILC